MQCKTLDEFKERLREAMGCQNMKKFRSLLLLNCPFLSKNSCIECSLYEKNGPKELTGPLSKTCLIDSMSNVFWRYKTKEINKEAALARLVLIGTELLAYLDSKESKG